MDVRPVQIPCLAGTDGGRRASGEHLESRKLPATRSEGPKTPFDVGSLGPNRVSVYLQDSFQAHRSQGALGTCFY